MGTRGPCRAGLCATSPHTAPIEASLSLHGEAMGCRGTQSKSQRERQGGEAARGLCSAQPLDGFCRGIKKPWVCSARGLLIPGVTRLGTMAEQSCASPPPPPPTQEQCPPNPDLWATIEAQSPGGGQQRQEGSVGAGLIHCIRFLHLHTRIQSRVTLQPPPPAGSSLRTTE